MNARGGLATRVILDFRELQLLASEWTDLWNQCPSATSFQRPEWVLAWTEAFRPQQLLVVEARREKKLVGLAPLFLYRLGNEKILAPLAASVSDYMDWLVHPAGESEILQSMFAVLRSSQISWDRLDLIDLPGSSSLLRFSFEDDICERSVQTVCPVLTLSAAAKSVEEMLPAKPRHNLRTARRRAEKLGRVQVEIANENTLDEFLQATMHLHGTRWTQCGTSGVLADEQVQNFHRITAPALLLRGVLRLYGMRLNGQLIATLYALAERGTVYCYLQGFDPAYSALSPGAQILAAVIDDALRQGKTKVDLLRGRESYKYTWGAKDEETCRLCVRRSVPQPANPVLAA